MKQDNNKNNTLNNNSIFGNKNQPTTGLFSQNNNNVMFPANNPVLQSKIVILFLDQNPTNNQSMGIFNSNTNFSFNGGNV